VGNLTEHRVASAFEQIDETAVLVRRRVGSAPDIAVTLGSGLGDFAATLRDSVSIDYAELPHWPDSTVVGHAGRLVVGHLRGKRVAALSGRVHVYEGHSPHMVAFPTRVMGRLGVSAIILTNAAGGINTSFTPGDLMVIDDHINLLGNPLVGPNDDRLGPRFPDMTDLYSSRLRRIADEAAGATGIAIAHGVYAAILGPSYETAAEIRFLRTIGADAVGMSTVPEAIAARHMGVEVLGISCITNMAAGVLHEPLVHDDVITIARRASGPFAALLGAIIERI
jgi:purine-nucleoside phosphorylase